jgi:hypothetical protein
MPMLCWDSSGPGFNPAERPVFFAFLRADVCDDRGRLQAAQIKTSASHIVVIPNSVFGNTLTKTSPFGLTYSIGFSSLRFARLKNGLSIVSR